MVDPIQAGQPSPIFGERFPYPFDGKTVLYEFATRFAEEFNEVARAKLRQDYGEEGERQWSPLTVTTAYPTTRAQIPRIAILRVGTTPRPSGLGYEYDEQIVSIGDGEFKVRKWAGEVITDQLEVAICTINERLRDDLFIWFQQYILDATLWAGPQLRPVGFYELRCTNAVDDQVEYQGSASQPGFEFYVARLNFQATYDLSIFSDIDQLKTAFNWESIEPGNYVAGGAVGDIPEQNPNPPDSVFQ